MRSPICSHLLSICAKQHSGLHFIRAGARETSKTQFSYVTGIAVEWVYQENVTISRWERWRHPCWVFFVVVFFLSIYVGGVARQVQGVGFLGLNLFTGYSLRGLRDDFSLKG